MCASICSAIIQLEPVHLQIPLTSRMDDKLRHISFGALKPFADYLGCAVLRKYICIVVFSDGGLVVPCSAAVDELGLDA